MSSKPKKNNSSFFSFLGMLLGIIFISGIFFVFSNILPLLSDAKGETKGVFNNTKLIAVAKAEEIYPEFICPCCGQPLNPDKICCGAMKERIEYIDEKVSAGYSKDEILLMTVKEFGINALTRPELQEEIKNKLLASAPADAPRIVFGKESSDLGQVSQSKGVADTLFDFANEGQGDLIINKLSTSCGCTSASIVYQGVEGPTFTMPGHGKENPENWSVAIAPGESAQVKVYYDPNAHGKQEEENLPITRTVSVFSNDPVEFEKVIKIELNQIP